VQGTWLGLATVVAAGVPGVFATYWSRRSSKQVDSVKADLVTGNDKTVGDMVTEVHGAASNEATTFETHGEMT